MSEPSPRILSVRRQPTDWRAAQYDRAQVAGLHWRDVSGGVNASLPHPFVHGYVLCNAMISAELPHSCRHGPPPHSVLVSLLKKDNPDLWPDIEQEIGPGPGTKKRAAWEKRPA
jgi:hypothetical protein